MFKNFTSDAMLIDDTGKTLPASHVFNVFIKAFVNDLTEKLYQRTDFEKGDIRWVIPVLGYLLDSEKQFLISCAEKVNLFSYIMMLINLILCFAIRLQMNETNEYFNNILLKKAVEV